MKIINIRTRIHQIEQVEFYANNSFYYSFISVILSLIRHSSRSSNLAILQH